MAEVQDSVFDADDKATIDYVQSTRKKLIKVLVGENDNQVPQSTSEKVLLAQLLDGSVATALAKTKIRKDDEANKTAANNQEALIEMLKTTRAGVALAAPATAEERQISPSIPKRSFVPGETDTTQVPLTYEGIMEGGK